MKITLNFKDIEKLIKDSYDGVLEITAPKENIDILIDVDGDNF